MRNIPFFILFITVALFSRNKLSSVTFKLLTTNLYGEEPNIFLNGYKTLKTVLSFFRKQNSKQKT